MGDATNLVIIFAGELLKMAETLIRMGGLQPSDIIQGYEKALDFTMETLKCWCTYLPIFILCLLGRHTALSKDEVTDMKSQSQLSKAIRTVIAAKQYGHEDLLADLVAEAVLAVLPKNPTNFNVDNIRVVKIMGSSLEESQVVKGMVFGREPDGTKYTQHSIQNPAHVCRLC